MHCNSFLWQRINLRSSEGAGIGHDVLFLHGGFVLGLHHLANQATATLAGIYAGSRRANAPGARFQRNRRREGASNAESDGEEKGAAEIHGAMLISMSRIGRGPIYNSREFPAGLIQILTEMVRYIYVRICALSNIWGSGRWWPECFCFCSCDRFSVVKTNYQCDHSKNNEGDESELSMWLRIAR